MTFKKTFEDSAGGAGVSDHGALTGLSDDDHDQYHNDVRGDARYAEKIHVDSRDGHPVATTTAPGFQSAADKARLDGVRPNNAYADLSLSANQTGIAHATWTPIYWNMEAADPRNWHSNTTSPELITLDSTGFYLITVYQRWASPNTSGARFIRVKVNGAGGPLFEDSASAATDSIGRITVARQFAVSASDFLVVEVNQTSGSILDLHSVTSMGIARIL